MIAASLGWSRAMPKSGISVVYSPAYVQGFYFNSFHELNHSFALNANYALPGKWRISASATAVVSDFSQLLFAPTQYGSIASAPATFDELAAAMLTGNSTNPALASLVSSAPAVTSPGTAYLYGRREFSTATQLNLSYARTGRSTFNISISGVRIQNIDSATSGDHRFYLPKTMAGSGSFGWSYALSPRTQIGASVSAGRTLSSYLDAYTTTANASIGRTMSRRWFLQASGGAGYITPVYQARPVPRNVQYLFNGGVGFKTYAHTFLASYSRNILDTYGLGAGATESSSGSWSWKRPGQSISLFATFGYMRLVGPAFPNTGSWTESAGASRAMGQHFAVSASYAHVTLPAVLALLTSNLSEQGVTLSLSWSPSVRR
jgi:hypothetical protein